MNRCRFPQARLPHESALQSGNLPLSPGKVFPMKRLLALFLTMATATGFAQSGRSIHEPPHPIPDSYFETIKEFPFSSWGTLNRLIETNDACSKMAAKPPLCNKASDELFDVLWQSLHQVMTGNVLAKDKGFTNVCDDYAKNLVIERKYGPQAAHALLLMDNHMKAAKPMYGSTIDQVPLYRVLYNAMVDIKPCSK